MLVEIWSDVVCPWCAVGKERFEQALARFDHADEVDVVWRSFELDPNAPKHRDGTLAEHLAAKYGTGLDQAQQMMDQMTRTAADEGLVFDFDRATGGNTFDAHRLLHLAREHGRQHELKDALFTAYFTDGRDISDDDVLVQIATEIGLDEVAAKDVIATDRFADEVRRDQAQAREYGIRGVPFFVVDQRYGVSGAQPADTLLQLLRQAHAESRPLQMVDHAHDQGDACADGSCAI